MQKNPGKNITKCQYNEIFRKAWLEAMKPSNICSGFKNGGIYPCNSEVIKPTISTENENKAEKVSDGK